MLGKVLRHFMSIGFVPEAQQPPRNCHPSFQGMRLCTLMVALSLHIRTSPKAQPVLTSTLGSVLCDKVWEGERKGIRTDPFRTKKGLFSEGNRSDYTVAQYYPPGVL